MKAVTGRFSRKKVVACALLVLFILVVAIIVIVLFVNSNSSEPVSDSGTMETETAAESGTQDPESQSPSGNSISQQDKDQKPTSGTAQNGQTQASSSSSDEEYVYDGALVPEACSTEGYLSFSQKNYCMQLYADKQNQENQAQQEAARQAWCDSNMPGIYSQYNSEILAEESKYEAQIESYIKGSSSSGFDESTLREIAEKTYGPLHRQNIDFIVSRYLSDAQSYGCDPYAYGGF